MPNCSRCSRELKTGDVFCPTCGTPNPDSRTMTPADAQAATTILPADELKHRLQEALGGDYVVEHEIGEGGFAHVLAVTDRKLQRRIAVKVLRPEFTANRNSIQRFIREAESAAKLSHPHILPIFFVGEKAGLVYFAMPLVDGETLDTRLRREGQLPEDEIIRLGGEIAEALAEAHGQGLVHRDVKPQNVMLQGAKKRAMVMDFGIAKAAAGTGEKLTGTGTIIGSPHYMSPEQAAGDPHVDQRSDVYSLGIVLWEMLAGEVPFDGPSTQGILIQHLTQTVPPIRTRRPGVSASLAKVVARCTEKKRDDRFQSAAELAAALSEAGRATIEGARAPRRLPLVPVYAALGVLILAGAGYAGWQTLQGGSSGAEHNAPASAAARVAVLPFEALVDRDPAQYARNVAQLLADALSGSQVPIVDGRELLGHWTEDGHQVNDPIATKAGFAYEHGANQMVLGTATQAGQQLRLSVDVYDTHDVTNLGHAEATGSADSLFALVEGLSRRVALSLCSQPDYNPQHRCFDAPPEPAESLVVTSMRPGGETPSSPVFLVRVDSAGGVADVRTRTPSSRDDINTMAFSMVRAAGYRPARLRGRPVSAWATVSVAVRMDSSSARTDGDATVASAGVCDVPGANTGNVCFDTRPVPLAAPIAAWSGAGEPTPPVLWLRVGTDGAVRDVRVVTPSSEPRFTEAATRAARALTFSPALKGGRPVAAWTQLAMTKE